MIVSIELSTGCDLNLFLCTRSNYCDYQMVRHLLVKDVDCFIGDGPMETTAVVCEGE